ncbi:MAG TPA: hypothetical protein DCE42_04225, partial [Myxococcales bacterium]|nr:hypothetical protein [Myxococcales bacterium]
MKEEQTKKSTGSRRKSSSRSSKTGTSKSNTRSSSSRGRKPSSRSSSSKTKSTKSAAPKQEAKSEAKEETLSKEELRAELESSQRPYSEWTILSDAVLKGVLDRGYTDPTPVQAASIEHALTKRDLVVQAKTGTGKTAAFGIPLLEMVEMGRQGPQALILAPTRELAKQVADELEKLSTPKGVRILPIYGGISINEQTRRLEEGVEIAVGTPGRVLDHIRRGNLDPTLIRFVVLDEADEMLSMGFYMEVANILGACREREQLMLYSATMPPDIEGLIRQFLDGPLRIMVSGGDRKVEGIQHLVYFVNPSLPRPRNMLYIIEHVGPGQSIIFCNTRNDVALLSSYLIRQGKHAESISGDMDQRDREKVIQKLRDGKVQFLIATDVAARGIDISGLTHVFNYNFPTSLDLYFHRVGRTGRQGKEGQAISLLTGS